MLGGMRGKLGGISNRILGKVDEASELTTPLSKATPEIEQAIAPGTKLNIPLTAVEKLRGSLKEVPGKIKEQEAITTAERARKFGEIGEIETPGRAGYYEELGKLKGEVPKVQGTALKLESNEIDELYDSIKNSIPDKPTSIRARGAVEKLLKGEIPQQNELDTLESYLGFITNEPGTAKQITARSRLREVYELARGFMSVDLPFLTSAAFSRFNSDPDLVKRLRGAATFKLPCPVNSLIVLASFLASTKLVIFPLSSKTLAAFNQSSAVRVLLVVRELIILLWILLKRVQYIVKDS